MAGKNPIAEEYIAKIGGPKAYAEFITAKNGGAPVYDPAAVKDFLDYANCYDYAVNDLDFIADSGKPGHLYRSGTEDIKSSGGKKEFDAYVQALKSGVKMDGAVYIKPENISLWKDMNGAENFYLVAMYAKAGSKAVAPEENGEQTRMFDFHFMRHDSDGGFSHKWGKGEVSRLDKKGVVITDPLTADMGEYQFISFLGIPRNGLDVGAGPRYNVNNIHLPPEVRRNLDAQLQEYENTHKPVPPDTHAKPQEKIPNSPVR